MQSRFDFGIFLALLLASASAFASPLQSDIYEASAQVPIVNECNGVPNLFHKDWHYRNTFGVVVKEGTTVKFELLNPQLLGNGEFSITCLQNTKEDDLALTFSQKTQISYEIVPKVTCVPTVGVLKLCNVPPVDLIVRLSANNVIFQELPVIEFKAFETYSFNKSDVDDFLKRIQYYGFAKTPRVQVLVALSDVPGLLINDLFINGLKVMNDVFEKYFEYNGRSSISIANGPRINMALEKDTLLVKSEPCSSKFSSRWMNNYTFSGHPLCVNRKLHKLGYRKPCNAGAFAYYGSDKVVALGNSILPFFTPNAKNFLMLHEFGHHFDLYTTDYFMNLQEIWVNIYASFYQSRFSYEDKKHYWMYEDFKNGVSNSQKLYDSDLLLKDFSANQKETVHFLMALFTLDNHDSSVFRSYNIRTMNDSETTENILKSIAVFIKDQYGVNVVPFIERAIYYKSLPWLNLTNIYDLADSKNFRMPCFYFNSTENDYPRSGFEEHDLKSVSNLRLCPTNKGLKKKIEITIENTELSNKLIQVNSIAVKMPKNIIEMESSEEVFVIWGVVNQTSVILPTYLFCNSKTNYQCAVAPKLLTYNDQNPSQLFPPFRFDIFGYGDKLIAILQVDVRNRKMMIRTLVENGHMYFPGIYVEIKLRDAANVEIASFKINGNGTRVGEFWYDIALNYNFELIASEKHRVKILDYNLNDLGTSKFKIDGFGVTEVDGRRKIRDRFARILSDDLEYKPYLKKYQHLTDLLYILKNNNEI